MNSEDAKAIHEANAREMDRRMAAHRDESDFWNPANPYEINPKQVQVGYDWVSTDTWR